MAFTRWDPIRDLLAIQQRLDRFAPGPSGWSPPVDLHETDEQYVLTAELPGLDRDDLQIHLHDGRLTLSGVRPRAVIADASSSTASSAAAGASAARSSCRFRWTPNGSPRTCATAC